MCSASSPVAAYNGGGRNVAKFLSGRSTAWAYPTWLRTATRRQGCRRDPQSSAPVSGARMARWCKRSAFPVTTAENRGYIEKVSKHSQSVRLSACMGSDEALLGPNAVWAWICVCPHCDRPTYFDQSQGKRTPGALIGNSVKKVPRGANSGQCCHNLANAIDPSRSLYTAAGVQIGAS